MPPSWTQAHLIATVSGNFISTPYGRLLVISIAIASPSLRAHDMSGAVMYASPVNSDQFGGPGWVVQYGTGDGPAFPVKRLNLKTTPLMASPSDEMTSPSESPTPE